MKNTTKITIRIGALAFALGAVAACGSGEKTKRGGPEAGEGSARVGTAAVEQAMAAVGMGTSEEGGGLAGLMAASREEVRLPSHRRLKSFLPRSLPGLTDANLGSGIQPGPGRSEATGRYQASGTAFLSGVRLEISYNGKKAFNTAEQFYGSQLMDSTEVDGFDALYDEDVRDGKTRCELLVRISPELWVQASGPGTVNDMRKVVSEVDLEQLAEDLASGKLFEESMEDRIERLLLEPDALVALMPDTLGPLEKRGGGGGTDLHRKPMRSRATSLYGMASLSLTDYGDPEIARQALTPARELQGFAMYTTGREDAVGSAPLAIEGGEGDWVWMKQEAPSPSAIGISIARGRFVIEYAGPFVPKPEPLDPSAPEEFRKQIEEIQKNQGAGAFESIEAQRDAVLQSIEAMDLDAFDN